MSDHDKQPRTTRKALRAFAQWLEDNLEIIDPNYPQGKMMDDGDIQEFVDEYWRDNYSEAE